MNTITPDASPFCGSIIVDLDPKGRVMMVRDLDLVRKIMEAIEAHDSLDYMRALSIDGYDADLVGLHLEMLYKAGFIRGLEVPPSMNVSYSRILAKDLSWDGHEFLGVLRQDTVMAKLKGSFSAKEFAALPLAVIKGAGMALLESVVKHRLGL